MGKSIKFLTHNRLSNQKRAITETEARRKQKKDDAEKLERESISDRATHIGWIVVDERDYITCSDGEVSRRVTWDEQGTWECFYLSKKVKHGMEWLRNWHPATVADSAQKLALLKSLIDAAVCVGNPDPKFSGLSCSQMAGYSLGGVLRHDSCELYNDKQGIRCKPCQRLRATLRGRLRSENQKKDDPERRVAVSSTAPRSSLSPEEVLQCNRNLHKALVNERSKTRRLVDRMKMLQAVDPIEVPTEVNELCTKVMEGSGSRQFEDSDVRELLWSQQRKASSLTDARGMRWHPMIVRWCLTVSHKSKSAYDYIRQSGFLALPTRSTLAAYVHYDELSFGVDYNAIAGAAKRYCESRLDVILLHDEMKIRDGIVYESTTGRMSGYVSVDNLSNSPPCVATHMLVYMVQSASASFSFPAANFATKTMKGEQIHATFWETVGALEMAGFRVRASVSDGASTNRRFIQLHEGHYPDDPMTYRSKNMFAPDRDVFFLSDLPHLMKTTRNCLENSGGHLKSRNLILHGKPIRWEHIQSLVSADRGNTGFVKAWKVNNAHVSLTSFTRMRVNLAVQVLSESVANALQLRDDPALTSTIELVRKMNKAFDVMNGSTLCQAARSRNPSTREYRSMDDQRFEWLRIDFIGWLDAWRDEVEAIEGLTRDERGRCQLSRPTLQGWALTCHSFEALSRALLDVEGTQFLLAQKLVCQDRLEQHFGRHRGATGSNSNPTTAQFLLNQQTFNLTRELALPPSKGNTQLAKTTRPTVIDSTPLKKRVRVR